MKFKGLLGLALVLANTSGGYHNGSAACSYLVQSSTYDTALAAVRRVNERVTHELPIIEAVAADLTPAQLVQLRTNKTLKITPDRVTRVSELTPGQEVQPYVVERTGANLLHAQGITGRGVTVAFLDTGWWSQHATQTNTAGKNVVLQGYDAIGNTVGVGAPADQYGHGTHV